MLCDVGLARKQSMRTYICTYHCPAKLKSSLLCDLDKK